MLVDQKSFVVLLIRTSSTGASLSHNRIKLFLQVELHVDIRWLQQRLQAVRIEVAACPLQDPLAGTHQFDSATSGLVALDRVEITDLFAKSNVACTCRPFSNWATLYCMSAILLGPTARCPIIGQSRLCVKMATVGRAPSGGACDSRTTGPQHQLDCSSKSFPFG